MTELTAYDLTGSLTLSEPSVFTTAPVLSTTWGQAVLEIRDSMGATVAGIELQQAVLCGPPCTAAAVEAQGLLTPGSYTLVASAEGSAMGGYVDVTGLEFLGGSASGSFDVALVLSGAEIPALPTAGRVVEALLLVSSGLLRLRRTV